MKRHLYLETRKVKLKLIWVPFKCAAVSFPHYSLIESRKSGYVIACIETNKQGAKIIRSMIEDYNNGQRIKTKTQK